MMFVKLKVCLSLPVGIATKSLYAIVFSLGFAYEIKTKLAGKNLKSGGGDLKICFALFHLILPQ